MACPALVSRETTNTSGTRRNRCSAARRLNAGLASRPHPSDPGDEPHRDADGCRAARCSTPPASAPVGAAPGSQHLCALPPCGRDAAAASKHPTAPVATVTTTATAPATAARPPGDPVQAMGRACIVHVARSTRPTVSVAVALVTWGSRRQHAARTWDRQEPGDY